MKILFNIKLFCEKIIIIFLIIFFLSIKKLHIISKDLIEIIKEKNSI